MKSVGPGDVTDEVPHEKVCLVTRSSTDDASGMSTFGTIGAVLSEGKAAEGSVDTTCELDKVGESLMTPLCILEVADNSNLGP